jgi:hypothetical protein
MGTARGGHGYNFHSRRTSTTVPVGPNGLIASVQCGLLRTAVIGMVSAQQDGKVARIDTRPCGVVLYIILPEPPEGLLTGISPYHPQHV